MKFTALAVFCLLVTLAPFHVFSQSSVQAQTAPALVITTEPNAAVWVDDIRRGNTDDSGKLSLKTLSNRRHTVRVRAQGFQEVTIPVAPGRRTLAVKLVPTTDQGELLFQQAEVARENAREDKDREKAIELYKQALKIKPAMASAHVGIARLHLDLDRFDDALDEIAASRRLRRNYAEASAVEGRIFREQASYGDAIRSYRRAIREAGGSQPEAHVGLARVFEDNGNFDEAIVEYRKALGQLSDSEPVIYQLLGAAYEKVEKPKEAAAAYEKYLELAPNGSYATAIRSILDQLKREAAGEQLIP